MIERVARALDPDAWISDGPTPTRADTISWHSRRQASCVSARAAIAAMLEPTEAMKEAWDRDFSDWLAERIEAEYHPYTVMIEEALK